MSQQEIPEHSGEVAATAADRVPVSFWIISALALVWNLLGIAAYVMQVTMTEEALLALPEAERALYQDVPGWAISAFAIAVNAGALGCILLLLRRNWALPMLVVSLLGVLVQTYHSIFVAGSIEVYGPGGLSMPVMVIVVAVFLIWYARRAAAMGWTK